MHGRLPKYRTLVSSILPKVADIADRQVASGIYRMWGSDLGWPAWIFDGTSLKAGAALPRKIGLADDLLILGNFLDHVGPEKLLASVTGPLHFQLVPRTFDRLRSAPDVESAIKFLVRALAIENYIVRFEVEQGDDDFGIRVSVSEDLGIVGEFMEITAATYLLHIAKVFEPAPYICDAPGRAELSIRGGLPSWHGVLIEAGEYEIHPNSSSTRLRLPKQWSMARNGSHDPVAWASEQEWLEARIAFHQESLSPSRLKSALRTVIESEHRVPRLKEIAKAEGISERTLARRIADLGITFQQVADEIRAELAVEMLSAGTSSIAGIAQTLGFSHSSSFARAFRDWYGCTPTQWRTHDG